MKDGYMGDICALYRVEGRGPGFRVGVLVV